GSEHGSDAPHQRDNSMTAHGFALPTRATLGVTKCPYKSLPLGYDRTQIEPGALVVCIHSTGQVPRPVREATLIKKQRFISGMALAASILSLAVGQAMLQQQADAQGSSVTAPMFEVDPLWPKPLPNNWLLGWTIGAWVDEQDHIWIIHRGAGG